MCASTSSACINRLLPSALILAFNILNQSSAVWFSLKRGTQLAVYAAQSPLPGCCRPFPCTTKGQVRDPGWETGYLLLCNKSAWPESAGVEARGSQCVAFPQGPKWGGDGPIPKMQGATLRMSNGCWHLLPIMLSGGLVSPPDHAREWDHVKETLLLIAGNNSTSLISTVSSHLRTVVYKLPLKAGRNSWIGFFKLFFETRKAESFLPWRTD